MGPLEGVRAPSSIRRSLKKLEMALQILMIGLYRRFRPAATRFQLHNDPCPEPTDLLERIVERVTRSTGAGHLSSRGMDSRLSLRRNPGRR